MPITLSKPQTVVIAVHTMILLSMLALFLGSGAFLRGNLLLLWAILLVPLLAIGWSIVHIGRRERILGYWALAILMIPIAGLGIFGGWGLLYLIGIIFLLSAAWMENEERT